MAREYNYEDVGERAVLCEDGKYRWKYNMDLIKNPSVFFLILKIFLCIFAVGFALMMIFDAVNFDDFFPGRLLTNLKFSGYVLIGIIVVTLLGYLLYAAAMGGKYTVVFEMDEKGINHKQLPSQAKTARKLGKAAAVAGAARGDLTAAGAGLAAQRTEMYSDFSKVKKVKAYPARRLIKVNGFLDHNQVYTAKEDFDFVKEYIVSHCGGLKK